MWSVYIVRCVDGTLYTGITTDVQRRLKQHNAGTGAKYTRGRCPCILLAERIVDSRSSALRLEMYVKRQRADMKLATLNGECDETL